MPKALSQPSERKHVHLFKGDWEELQELFPDLTPSVAIRQITRNAIRKIKAKRAQTFQDVEVNVEEILEEKE